MNLSELAFACYLYEKFTNYDKAFLSFQEAIGNTLNFKNSSHRIELLKWLNQWGCRQFKLDNHDNASTEILTWFKKYSSTLFSRKRYLWELTDQDFINIEKVFDSLKNKTASIRNRNGKKIIVKVGPTGSSKILFALRKNALPPWDQQIRDKYKYNGSGLSYCQYLKHIKSILKKLEASCRENGFSLKQLPEKLNRHNSTIPKLIDEYNWVVITRKCSPPNIQILQSWIEWN